jgi:hypothetical protein
MARCRRALNRPRWSWSLTKRASGSWSAPIADGVALQAWDRVHRTLQDRRVPPTGYRLLAPGGGYQHRRLHVAAVATSDLEVLESALQMLLRALLPDDEPDLTDLRAEIAIDYSTSPANMVGRVGQGPGRAKARL